MCVYARLCYVRSDGWGKLLCEGDASEVKELRSCHVKIWVKRFPTGGRGESRCKGPEVESSLVALYSVLSLFPKHSVCRWTQLGSKCGFTTYWLDNFWRDG